VTFFLTCSVLISLFRSGLFVIFRVLQCSLAFSLRSFVRTVSMPPVLLVINLAAKVFIFILGFFLFGLRLLFVKKTDAFRSTCSQYVSKVCICLAGTGQ